MYTRKICIALGKSYNSRPIWNLCFSGEMRGLSDNTSVIQEENEVPYGAFAQTQETAVLRKF